MIGFDHASFRDPSGRLFRHRGAIYRTCSADAVRAFQQARDRGLLDELEQQGLFLQSELTQSTAAGLNPSEVGEWLVRQPELPLVSYSYEWSFSMLRDAALVTLRALDTCLAKGFVLKDSTSFNVIFEGTQPRLVDVHSLESRVEGTLWAGYTQFCRAFLFPLFLQSYKGINPRPLLLAGLGEIGIDEMDRLFGWRDALRPGILVNVAMQAQLQRKFAGRAEDVQKAGAGMKYPVEAVRSQARKLRKTIEQLRPPSGDEWTTYTQTHTYEDASVRVKEGFVDRALRAQSRAIVLDLGTNTGQYARLARTCGARVVAVDVSAGCIDALYRASAGDTSLSPVVADLTRPTPPIGWRLIERKGLLDRLRGDFLLALALIHHLRITGGIPLSEIVDLLTRLAPSGVLEWVGRDDLMVRRLLALRPDVYQDYALDHFEQLLSERSAIVAREDLGGGRRILFHYGART